MILFPHRSQSTLRLPGGISLFRVPIQGSTQPRPKYLTLSYPNLFPVKLCSRTAANQQRANQLVVALHDVRRALDREKRKNLMAGEDEAKVPAIAGFDPAGYYAATADAETKEYIMQQTMLRVRDPKVSLAFYCEVLGFQLIWHTDFPQWGFSLYFVVPPVCIMDKTALGKLRSEALTPEEKFKFCMTTPGCVELTWNYGSEKAEEMVYNTGNSDKTGVAVEGGAPTQVKGGFGHIGISVPDVYAACDRFHKLGVTFHKSPNSGGMKGMAFIKDPDNYLVEILPQGPMVTREVDCLGVELSAGGGYKDNSSK